jgi:hypothetical protein
MVTPPGTLINFGVRDSVESIFKTVRALGADQRVVVHAEQAQAARHGDLAGRPISSDLGSSRHRHRDPGPS